MKKISLNKFISYSAVAVILFMAFGCSTADRVGYSSTANREQKVSLIRTEMLIIKGDDENVSRDFSVVSAVDYLHEGKKIYYLIIAPSSSSKPSMDNLKLEFDYPYIILGQNVNELLSNIEKITKEWDSTDVRYSGAVYNFFISSPQNSRPWLEGKTRWWEEKQFFEIVPYVKFNYSKNETGAVARLAVGSRVEQILYTSADGKTERGRIFVQDDEKVWVLDKVEKMKDFQNLLTKGLQDLKEKGMDGPYKKVEIKAEVKPEIVPEVKPEVKPVEKKIQRKIKKKKKI